MNKRMEPYSSPDDRDIGALFDAQNINPPSDLDPQILAAARHAVEGEVFPSRSRASSFRPWLAAAAVAMIAIGITPQLLQSPESSLDNAADARTVSSVTSTQQLPNLTTTDDVPPWAAEDRSATPEARIIAEPATQKVSAMPAQSPGIAAGAAGDAESERANRAPALTINQVAEEAALAAQTPDDAIKQQAVAIETQAVESLVPTTLNINVSGFATLSELTPPDTADFRLEPETWIQEMRRLETENLYAAARLEYDRFRTRFPAFKTTYRPRVSESKTPEEQQ